MGWLAVQPKENGNNRSNYNHFSADEKQAWREGQGDYESTDGGVFEDTDSSSSESTDGGWDVGICRKQGLKDA